MSEGIDHHEGESREEPPGFALEVAARKLAKFYVEALAGQRLSPILVRGWAASLRVLRCAPGLMPPQPPGSSICMQVNNKRNG